MFTKWAKKGTNAGKREQTRDKRKSSLQRFKLGFDTIAMMSTLLSITLQQWQKLIRTQRYTHLTQRVLARGELWTR
ncbi:hypothetical protein HMPREF3216_00671 [Gardnerella vaginalis]|uniref:Uncharacterized protein n=1 Tax=Gardnerella vaginalis TaxID=2702 RepID=A0A133NPK1_GARVA|nr:hypothetical protein HMPREF3216_00671 [Gardnerella vaginalis]